MRCWTSSINRNIVECKDDRINCCIGSGSVLIETLWNVKSKKATYVLSRRLGINRNIVECKV